MAYVPDYDFPGPTRDEVDHMPGPVLLEFGTDWCGHCQAIQAALAARLANFPDVTHIKVEDGKGRPLGRSFRVKLWPNFVFLRDGVVVGQVARPGIGDIERGLQAIAAASAEENENAGAKWVVRSGVHALGRRFSG